jgi:hypothetical protein
LKIGTTKRTNFVFWGRASYHFDEYSELRQKTNFFQKLKYIFETENS